MFKKIFDELKNCLIKKRYLTLLLYILLFLSSIGLILLIIVFFFRLIDKYFIEILIIVISSLSLYFWISEKRNTRKEEKAAEIKQIKAEEYEIERTLAESNYSIVRQCLFSIISENADALHLAKPTTLSELDSPSRIIRKGTVMMYQYLTLKKGDVDTIVIKEIIQTRITQKLLAQEFSGITQTTYIYNGKAYPLLYIDEIQDQGAYIQIDMAWVNDNYCNHLQNKAYTKLQNQKPINANINDRDF